MLSEETYLPLVRAVATQEEKALETVAFLFVSDETLHQLNLQHLNHDTLTDILTFPYSYDPIRTDIYISVDRVAENAIANNVTFITELHRVMIHGLLHMCGWEDHSAEQKELIRNREAHYMTQWQ